MAYRIGIDARTLQEPRIGTYVQQLVRSLSEIDEENRYVLFVGGSYEDEFDDLPENFRLVVERSPVYSFRERLALSWRQFRQQLDLYHATHYMLPLWITCRSVTTVHDIIDLLCPDFVPGRLSMLVAPARIRGTLARSDRIIAASENTKTDLVDYFDVRRRRIVPIYPGVDATFTAQAELDEAKVLDTLGVHRPFVLFRGDDRRHKNEERMLRAFATVCAQNEAVTLVGIGDKELSPERFDYLTASLGIEQRVRWLDDSALGRLPVLLRNAELFVFPTLYEGFPAAVIEAMACGVPVVTAHNATIKEVAEGAAKLVDATSTASLAGAIGWCLNDAELRRNLAADGLVRVQTFRWQRVAERTLAVYEDALNKGGARGRFLPRRVRSA